MYKQQWENVETNRTGKQVKSHADHELAKSRMEAGAAMTAVEGKSRNSQKY